MSVQNEERERREESTHAWKTFLAEIDAAGEALSNPEVVWYRGHAHEAYTLVPSLLRFVNGFEREQVLFEKFQHAAVRLMDKRESDWGTLFDMQHYYVPTRLLDWTEVLGVAVYFATLRSDDAAVFVLDPVALNRLSGQKAIKRPDEKDFHYRSIYWEKRPFSARLPIAMEPPQQNERIYAQKGVFTIHGDDSLPLEKLCPDVVRKVVLPREALPAAREFLRHAGINEFSIFPDIVGLAPFIKNVVRLVEPARVTMDIVYKPERIAEPSQ